MSDKLLFAELTQSESDAIKGGLTYKDPTPGYQPSKFHEIFVNNDLFSAQQVTAVALEGDANGANHLKQEVTTNIQVGA